MNIRRTKAQNSESMAASNALKEFDMTLPMTVSGLNVQGQEFRENSFLSTISSERASFLLKTKVEPQSLLKLVIALPPKLADGQPLALVIKGKVVAIKPLIGKDETQKIILKLDSRYFIGVE
ncbi:MAG: PilZ domain-containing protein [Candidatus Saccharicenans sp.]|nr:PilZ domain-containing protein [Candidatus Saccharicenans sp.]